jgi:hypothetical protein
MNRAAPRSVALAMLAYRLLLRLYPRWFQRRFADEMIQVFHVTCHDSWRHGGGWELFALTLTTAFDVTTTATREHVTQGRREWGELMAPGAWDRSGGLMAAGAIVLGALVMTFGPQRAPAGQPVSLTSDDVIGGVQMLSVVIVFIVIGAMLRTQRTWIGRLSGRVALIGVGLHFFFVDLWLATPLLNAHPHVRSILAAWGGLLVALSLLGGIGLIISAVRYREMEGWRGGGLRWRRWALIGSGVGLLMALFLHGRMNLTTLLLVVGSFTALAVWAYLAGTALGLLQSSWRAHALRQLTS